ncbi:PREDICTED: uncharacterized protein LOC109117170 [Tarenaya hassleriana]|uniref:uncharacterized protein LOC109117170 n=1 Tax=Tarenaya hassleriana TaxID=28532 RepID=UPI0008FD33A1|nr:PREDICTED: uncharacterized protein LOC109117170 [Tarenaya hassleriana]
MNKIAVKLSSKCFHIEAVEYLEKYLTEEEMRYFTEESPFRHIFHMKKKQSLKMSLMVALINRVVKTKKDDELWFVINGCPIRYSLWEHALLSGLKCSPLPENLEEYGGIDFYRKYFGQDSFEKVTKGDVMDKFGQLTKDDKEDGLKMAYLLLLSYVIGHQHSEYVNPLLLRIVNSVEDCEQFPWGTFTFKSVHGFILNYLNKHRKPVNQWNLPGFIIPLTMLPFECIPKLRSGGWYNIVRPEGNVTETCPRMCKRCFIPKKKYGIKQGLTRIGRTQDIASILFPEHGEASLLDGLEIKDNFDEVVDSWIAHLIEDPKSVKWKDILEADVKSRVEVPMMLQQKKRKLPASPRKWDKKRGKTDKGKKPVTDNDVEEEEEEEGEEEEEVCSRDLNKLRAEVRQLKGKIQFLGQKLVETETNLQKAIEDQGEYMKKLIIAGMIAADEEEGVEESAGEVEEEGGESGEGDEKGADISEKEVEQEVDKGDTDKVEEGDEESEETEEEVGGESEEGKEKCDEEAEEGNEKCDEDAEEGEPEKEAEEGEPEKEVEEGEPEKEDQGQPEKEEEEGEAEKEDQGEPEKEDQGEPEKEDQEIRVVGRNPSERIKRAKKISGKTLSPWADTLTSINSKGGIVRGRERGRRGRGRGQKS